MTTPSLEVDCDPEVNTPVHMAYRCTKFEVFSFNPSVYATLAILVHNPSHTNSEL